MWGGSAESTCDIRKYKRNGGFTLVELIVVIVILAILAAILVPALLGYIDKAKNSQYVLRAKNAMTATQLVLAEMYAKGEPAYNIGGSNPYDSSCTKQYYEEVLDLIDDTGLNDACFTYRVGYGTNKTWSSTTDREAYMIKVACYIYQAKAGGKYKILLYDGQSWTDTEYEYTSFSDARSKSQTLLRNKLSSGWTMSIKSIQ